MRMSFDRLEPKYFVPFWKCSLLTAGVFLAFGCATITPPIKVDEATQLGIESRLGTQLAMRYESKVKLVRDSEVETYFNHLAESLLKGSIWLQHFKVQTRLAKQTEFEKWSHKSLVGNHLYLSIPLLKLSDHEVEYAAAVALELSHLQETSSFVQELKEAQKAKDLATTENKTVNTDSAENTKPLKTPREKYMMIMQGAVELLYGAGFDPRGLVTFYQKLEPISDRLSSELGDLDFLREVTDECRHKIAATSPLRNPRKQSVKFKNVRGRIREL